MDITSPGVATACAIRCDTVVRLRATDRPPEAGDDLVKNEQRTGSVRHVLEPLKITGRWLGRVHRLQHDGGKFARMLFQQFFYGVEVPVWCKMRKGRDRGRHPEIS